MVHDCLTLGVQVLVVCAIVRIDSERNEALQLVNAILKSAVWLGDEKVKTFVQTNFFRLIFLVAHL